MTTELANEQTSVHNATVRIVKFVKLHNADKELIQNSSAKVFREIDMRITADKLTVSLGSVTQAAAEGQYHNGAINKFSAEFDVAKVDRDAIIEVLGGESYMVVNKILYVFKCLEESRTTLANAMRLFDGA